MWITNTFDSSVTKIAPDGSMTRYQIGTAYTYCIAFDGVNMWITDYGAPRVFKIAPDGTYTQFPVDGQDQW